MQIVMVTPRELVKILEYKQTQVLNNVRIRSKAGAFREQWQMGTHLRYNIQSPTILVDTVNALGMPLAQVIQIVKTDCANLKNVHVVYDEQRPMDKKFDLIVDLSQNGLRLLFDPLVQRLKVIFRDK